LTWSWSTSGIGCRSDVAAAKARGQQLGRPKAMTDEQVSHAIALLSQPKASAKAIAKLLGVSRSTLYAYVPQLAAIRAATVKQAAAEVPAQRPALTREPEPWWQLAEFTLGHSNTHGWQLTHRHYPANSGHPIPVENYPTGNVRLRRNIVAAQIAAAAAIEDLTGQRVQDWEEDEDGAGEPYWEALLEASVPEPVGA
jgi:AcrR family transcriptional regulator